MKFALISHRNLKVMKFQSKEELTDALSTTALDIMTFLGKILGGLYLNNINICIVMAVENWLNKRKDR